MLEQSTKLVPDEHGIFTCNFGAISLRFQAHKQAPVTLVAASGAGMEPIESMPNQRDAQPIVEMVATESGTHDNRIPLTRSIAGSILRFVSATYTPSAHKYQPNRLEITQFASFDDLHPNGRDYGEDYTITDFDSATDCATPTENSEGVTVTSVYEAYPQVSAVRCFTRVSSTHEYSIEAVSSLNISLPTDAYQSNAEHAKIYWANSAWAVENDWHSDWMRNTPLRDRNFDINPGISSSRFVQVSTSTWSTGTHEPDGIIELYSAERHSAVDGGTENRGTVDSAEDNGVTSHNEESRNTTSCTTCGHEAEIHDSHPCCISSSAQCSAMWQIEHNGPWEWEVSESNSEIHISCFGPEYEHHHWYSSLTEPIQTVPAVLVLSAGDWQQAVAQMTHYRRALRLEKAQELHRLSEFETINSLVVYNDYMNTLFGDPHIEKELPLIEGASKLGVDIFCIDAGWYDSTDGGWWDMVGDWHPSTNRFGDGGLKAVADSVKQHNMSLGLWLEPEVIGVKSELAKTLPDSAFISRHGVRVSDSGRYLLDFRSPEARAHLDTTIDKLIQDFDVRFFKFDYNTIPGTGTDHDAESAGSGLLEHCRAYLEWLDALRTRHPDVMIENCGSGAMRADYAQLSRLDMQSTSDQCDPLLYAGLAASAGITILPEQQGNWGYAQQSMSDETAVFTLATGVLGRLYLSGFVNLMDEQRLSLVREAVKLHRHVLDEQTSRDLVPWWPYGLPEFSDDWLVSGLRTDSAASATAEQYGYLTVWHRSGQSSISIPLPEGAKLTQVFPSPQSPENAPEAQPWQVSYENGSTTLTVTNSNEPSARIYKVTW